MSELKYRVVIGFDPEKECYVARAPELEECSAEGETADAALTALNEEIKAQVSNIKEAGGHAPTPLVEEDFSGEVTLKISKTMHRELVWLARLEELYPLLLRDELRPRREDGRDPDQVEVRHACVAERRLEARELLLVLADALREEDALRYHRRVRAHVLEERDLPGVVAHF